MIPIFLYHQIAHVPPGDDPRRLAVAPDVFERQMARLHARGYVCLSLDEVVTFWQRRLPLPPKCFALTFDDGYADLYATVWPILERFGFTATVFLVPRYVERSAGWDEPALGKAAPLLGWSQIRALADAGITFGSHTQTHAYLPALSPEAARRELQESKAALENALAREVTLFAYPFGASSPALQRLVAEAGYRAACGVDRGAWSRYNIWRRECRGSQSDWSFWRKRTRAYHWYLRFREQTALGRGMRRARRALRGPHPVPPVSQNAPPNHSAPSDAVSFSETPQPSTESE